MKMEEIPKLSTKELEEYLDAETTEYDHRGRQYALEEYNRRKLKIMSERHWSITPTFFLVLISVILALVVFLQQNQLLPKYSTAQEEQMQASGQLKPEAKTEFVE